jgi:DNA gyrase/topoisomerase IV subunit A
MEHITGPDFPTGGIIYGKSGIVDAYRTGKGRLHIRGKYHFEEDQKMVVLRSFLPRFLIKSTKQERLSVLLNWLKKRN